MKKTFVAGLGCVIVAVLLVLKTCGASGADDSLATASHAARKERTAPGHSSLHPPVERTGASKGESRWPDPNRGVDRRVRKILEMHAIASVEMVGGEAVGTVTIRTAEFGEIWRSETKAWEKMTTEEFREWRGGAHDRHKVTATLSKSLDPQTKRPVVTQRESIGDGTIENNAKPTADYDETRSGINIKLTWEGDKLIIKWMAAEIEQQAAEVALPFAPRYLD